MPLSQSRRVGSSKITGRRFSTPGARSASSSRRCRVDEALAGVDGLLLTGGDDVAPSRYGEAPHPSVEEVDPARDEFEIGLIAAARARDLPDLRDLPRHPGAERRRGGTLVQDIPSQVTGALNHNLTVPPHQAYDLAHEIWLEKDSLLAKLMGERLVGNDTCEVNSRHHQAVKTVGAGFRVTATAPDGVIEAIEDPRARFCLGVQWHPENFWRTGEFRPLFEGFLEAARNRHNVRVRLSRTRPVPRHRTEDEIDGPHEAQAGPEEIELDRLLHVEDREGDEHGERDDLLQDLQLRQLQGGVADPIGGTCSRYSKKAMPQLARTATMIGFALRSRRCAYHAKVMKMFESTSNVRGPCHYAHVRPRVSRPVEHDDRLDMGGVGKQIERVHSRDAVPAVHEAPRIPRERGDIARHVHDSRGAKPADVRRAPRATCPYAADRR